VEIRFGGTKAGDLVWGFGGGKAGLGVDGAYV